MANLGPSFDEGDLSNLVSEGRGRNYGLELTLTKNYRNGFYTLVTASVFESQYQGSDGVWRNTAFNTNWILNGLIGREFPFKKNLIFTLMQKSAVPEGGAIPPFCCRKA